MLANHFARAWRPRRLLGVLLVVASAVAGCGRSPDPPERAIAPTADSVLDAMLGAYQHAKAYRDKAVVRLRYRRGGRSYEDAAPLAVAWQRPNRIHVRAYQANVVCDGEKLFARIKDQGTSDLDGQVVVRDAPPKLELKQLYEQDEMLSLAFRQGLAGYPLQLDLLLSKSPLAALLDAELTRELLEPANIEGRMCHRVAIVLTDGSFVLWVDRQNHTLRRIEYPASSFAPEIAEDKSVEDLQLTVDFQAAEFREKLPQGEFAFNVPVGARRVRRFIPPPRQLPSTLFGQTTAPYAFASTTGENVSSASLADRIKVLLWFNNHPACQSTIQQLNQVFQQYKSQDRVAIYGVCAEPSTFTNEQIEELLSAWHVELPIARDLEAFGRDLFKIPWAPTMVVLDGKNVVQIFEIGANPNLVAELPQVLERLLNGEDLAAEILERFEKEHLVYQKALERGEPDAETVTQTAHAVRPTSSPKLLQLRPFWTNSDLKANGNILAIPSGNDSTTYFIFEGWRTITQLDGQGRLRARHELDLPELAAVSQLQSAVDANGHRFFVAWSLRNLQAHVFDDQWNRVLSYPPTAVTHDGVQDAVLADLDEDGQLELYVGFWGSLGVHCVALNGDLRWKNAAATNVFSLMPVADQSSQPTLWVASATGKMMPLTSQGKAGKPVENGGQLIHHLFGATLASGSTAPYCGISYGSEGRRLAIGLDRSQTPQWRYNLPAGSFPTQIRFVASAPLLGEGTAQWVVAGTDGSLHIISQDGRFTDHFQTGKSLAGVAGGRYQADGVLVISSDAGVQAWTVIAPATAAKH